MAAGGVPPSGALPPHLPLHPLPARVARLAQEERAPGAVQTVHGLLSKMPGTFIFLHIQIMANEFGYYVII